MRKIELLADERIDDLQRNGYRIIQNTSRFCFGMDAVLLSGFATARQGDRVLDLGTGTGIIPLLMAAKTEASQIIGLEIQLDMAAMATRSVQLNDLENRIEIRTGDIREANHYFGKAAFDVVTTNPPYIKDCHGLKNPQESKAIARHEVKCTLEDVVREAAEVLKPQGHLFMIHRPHRLAEIMAILHVYHLEPKRIKFVHPFLDKEANMVLIEAVSGAGSHMHIEAPIIVYQAPGQYSQEIYDLYGY